MTHLETRHPADLGLVPDLVRDHLTHADPVRAWRRWEPTEEGLGASMHAVLERDHPVDLVADVLREQYADRASIDAVNSQLDRWTDDTTVQVVTAHQPCLFTGPLYVIYKCLSAIALARHLNQVHPGHHVVPVYWMGGEDHDLDEMGQTHVFGKRIDWAPGHAGAVGRMPTDAMDEPLDRLADILGDSDQASALVDELRIAYRDAHSFGEATLRILHRWLGPLGLVVLNADDARLKRVFSPVMERELRTSFARPLVEDRSSEIEKSHHAQAHARDINLFLLEDGARRRWERGDDGLRLMGDEAWRTEDEVIDLLHTHPERFSPNVILRPVYQQAILRSLAYVGGPGELSYWLQLPPVLEAADVHEPVLLLRNMVLNVPRAVVKRQAAWDLDTADWFTNVDHLVKRLVVERTEAELSLDDMRPDLEALYDRIGERAAAIDPNLAKSVAAEHQKALGGFETIEKKMVRGAKRNAEEMTQRIRSSHERLFPNGALQERTENITSVLFRHGPDVFDTWVEQFDPIGARLHIFEG